MKSTIYLRTLILSFCFIMVATLSTQAAYYENPVTTPKSQKKWEQKWKVKKQTVTEKLKKLFSKSSSDESIRPLATMALICGLLSIVGLFVGFFYSLTVIIILAGVLALLGDIFAIQALRRIRNSENPREYRGSRVAAIVGLVLSLLTGLIPLAIYITIVIILFLNI